MDDSLATPVRPNYRLLLDNSIPCTPNPQATSTVERHVRNGFEFEMEPAVRQDLSLSSDSDKHKQFLSGAIDDLRGMARQLEALSMSNNSDSENMPPRSPDAPWSRRSSYAAESVGNSSLGILNVNDLEYKFNSRAPSARSTFDGVAQPSSAPPEDTFDWNGFSSRSILGESNFSSPFLSAIGKTTSPAEASAALKLEMQKALAQRAMKRASEKSQNGFEEIKSKEKKELSRCGAAWDMPSLTYDAKTKSRESYVVSAATPGAPQVEVCSPLVPFSPQDTQIPDISKESFVPGELALSRLEKDEDSWRNKFGGFPDTAAPTSPDDRASSVSARPTNVTQSLDLSMSGVISGDITVSSSLAASLDKKRISAGEYFGLRSEQLGRLDTDSPEPPPESERPNFGNEIHSPKNIRRVPLVQGGERTRLSDVSLDKVPTRDTGLFADEDRPSINTFDFTFDSNEMSARDSAELMPPPPPPPSESVAPKRRESSRASKTRRSLQVASSSAHNDASKRLSMSLSDMAGAGNIANVSYMSEDDPTRRASNQTVASLSHIAQLLSDMSGRMSTRIVVDNLLEGCTGSSGSSKSRPRSSADDSQSEGAPKRSSRNSTPKSSEKGSGGGSATLALKGPDERECNMSVKERVTEWMSKSDVNAEREHVRDEMHVERIVASNSPCQSTPRESLVSDMSSAGLSERASVSASASGSTATSKHQLANNSHSTPVIGPRHRNVHTDAPLDLPAHFRADRNKTSERSSKSTCTAPAEIENTKSPSVCGSVLTTRTVSRHGDTSSLSASSPFHVDSTHTQLSWPSVPLGSNKTQYFALRNKSTGRIRLLVSSVNPAFKLLGERGEGVSELTVAMHCEEARRIHVVFSPAVAGPVVSRLVISRIGAADIEQRRERRLIPLYGVGGQAQVIVEGAPKDQWAQLFVNLTYVDGDLSGATFCARNSGDSPAFVTAEISTEGVPFSDCGVTISPTTLTLLPGQSARLSLRWEPSVQVLEWLAANAGDVHVLANVWLSWAELSTWQRIARLYRKYYFNDHSGPLAQWGVWYRGDLQSISELKDNKSAENSLVQSLRRIKVAVLGEREMLRGFDLDASVVFQQLTVNDTVIMNSPLEDDRTMQSTLPLSSPVLSEIVADSRRLQQQPDEEQPTLNADLDLNTVPVHSDSYVVRFPPTLLNRKTSSKITFKNTSTQQHHVTVRGVTEPFTVPTCEFDISGNWYMNLRVFFKAQEAGHVRRLIEIWVDGQYKLTYELVAEGIESLS